MHIQTHILSGWCIANQFNLTARERAFCMVATTIADLDGLGILFGQQYYWEYHHKLGHNLFFGLLSSLILACFSKQKLGSVWKLPARRCAADLPRRQEATTRRIGMEIRRGGATPPARQRRKQRPRGVFRQSLRTFPLYLALFHLHLVLDYFGSGPGWHIHYLWPFGKLILIYPNAWDFYSWQNLLAFLIFFLWTLWIARQQGRTPIETITPRLDQEIVTALRRATHYRSA